MAANKIKRNNNRSNEGGGSMASSVGMMWRVKASAKNVERKR